MAGISLGMDIGKRRLNVTSFKEKYFDINSIYSELIEINNKSMIAP